MYVMSLNLAGFFIILIALEIFKTHFVWVKFCEIWQFLTKNVVKLWCICTHIIIDRCLVPNLVNRLLVMPNKQLSHNAVHSCLQNKDTDLWITEELISPEPVRGGNYMHLGNRLIARLMSWVLRWAKKIQIFIFISF